MRLPDGCSLNEVYPIALFSRKWGGLDLTVFAVPCCGAVAAEIEVAAAKLIVETSGIEPPTPSLQS